MVCRICGVTPTRIYEKNRSATKELPSVFFLKLFTYIAFFGQSLADIGIEFISALAPFVCGANGPSHHRNIKYLSADNYGKLCGVFMLVSDEVGL
jgi:hypothetical protein